MRKELMTKHQVRARARKLGLGTAEKPESQDVCFIPDQSLPQFLDGKVPMSVGDIEDTRGKILGRHYIVFAPFKSGL